ncbi:hypothetical protein A2U01_0113517, partial [Trifolium medium]|nr:hypothetical protein [Trifolium medium]
IECQRQGFALCLVEGGAHIRKFAYELLELSFHLSDGDFAEPTTGYDHGLRKILPAAES